MSYRLMFIINAVVLALIGVAFMLMPQSILAQFKSEIYVATLYAARFFGGALLLGGLLLWFLKDLPAKVQKNVAFVLFAYSIGGFALSLYGMTSLGVLRANGWVLLVIFGLFALVYGYILFLQPKPVASKSRSPRKAKGGAPSENEEQSYQ
jgi:peptidoglycan/LPS O-acetylase OafA/YrhL